MKPETLEAPCATERRRRSMTIGLPAGSDADERRFPITPEGIEQLRDLGYTVKMQSGAAASIHYNDNAYSRCGAEIVTESEALSCDIVIHMSPLTMAQAGKLRRGAMLLTMLKSSKQTRETIKVLLDKRIIAIAVDLIADSHGNHPFADIMCEIEGRASVTMAAALLADSLYGKGILLGGVAGIVPCEVTILGSGIAAFAAARSAIGAGAVVRMFDNDIYRLRQASRDLGDAVISSSLHPKVLTTALRTADVIINTLEREALKPLGSDMADVMKRGAIVFDLSPEGDGSLFPTLPAVNAALRDIRTINDRDNNPTRLCITSVGGTVPRTAAMALTNTFVTTLRSLSTCDGSGNALKLLPGLQGAAYTFLGHAVNPDIAAVAGVRHVDISLYLSLS